MTWYTVETADSKQSWEISTIPGKVNTPVFGQKLLYAGESQHTKKPKHAVRHKHISKWGNPVTNVGLQEMPVTWIGTQQLLKNNSTNTRQKRILRHDRYYH